MKKIILYGCGDFIDDYAVDEIYKNDLSFLYKLYLNEKTNEWHKIELFPSKIKHMQVNCASDASERDFLFRTMTRLCKAYGTKVKDEKTHLTISIEDHQA